MVGCVVQSILEAGTAAASALDGVRSRCPDYRPMSADTRAGHRRQVRSRNEPTHTHTHTHTRLTALCPGLPGWAAIRKVKPIWILLAQETVSGSGISLAICKSAPRSRQITTPAPRHSVFNRPDALPAAQPTASKHWRQVETNLPVVYLLNVYSICCRIHAYIPTTERSGFCEKVYNNFLIIGSMKVVR